jgi:hypothetical protein
MRREANTRQVAGDPLYRSRFSDGQRHFTVRASSTEVPDSFQVYAGGNHADIVVTVSGLATWNLRATWGDGWRSAGDAPRWHGAWNRDEWCPWITAEARKVVENPTR